MTTLTESIVSDLIKKHNITLNELESDKYYGLLGSVWQKIYQDVRKMKPAVLGIVSANSTPSNNEHGRFWSLRDAVGNLDTSFNGYAGRVFSARDYLRVLATATLICKIQEQLAAQKDMDEFIEQDQAEKNGYNTVDEEPHQVWFTEGPCGHNGWE
jgi:hypothetical protein